MRRKDLKYYLKTLELKWNAFQFMKGQNSERFQKDLTKRRDEYQTKWEQTIFEVQPFNLQYFTYFYLKSVDVFDGSYKFENGFPVSLTSDNNSNPLFPIYYGLVHMNTESFDIKLHDAISRYVLDVAKQSETGYRLEYTFDYDLFGLRTPWISGITQSLATSYFLRLYAHTKDSKNIESAESFFAPCLISFENDGLLRSTSKGLEWVEEYPSEQGSYVLNGHIFAIIASLELYQLSEKVVYKHTAEQWIRSFLYHFPEYQYKQFILHNKQQNKLSNLEYQGLYVGLFKHLYECMKHPLFLELFQYYNNEVDWERFNRFYGM